MSAARVLGAAVLVVVTLVAACSPAPADPTILPTGGPQTTPTITASATTTATQVPASPIVGGPVRDDSLLAILPPTVGGVPVTVEDTSFDAAVADPAFARNVGSAAFAIVVSGGDLASGVAATLRPGVFSDAFFRDWRDTYNVGACEQSGGVAGTAETEIDGRTVYIGTCAGGLRTYHAYITERGVIVSLFSVGAKRFGEQLVSDLRP